MSTVSGLLNDAEEIFRAELDVLDVKSGSVLVLSTRDNVELSYRYAQTLRRVLYARNLDDVTILVVAEGTDLSTVPEPQMREAGWVRATEEPASDVLGQSGELGR